MHQPFEKTMDLVNGLIKPGIQFLKASDREFAPLQVAVIESQVALFEDLAQAASDPNRKVALFEFGLTPQMFYAFDCAPLCMETFQGLFVRIRKEVFYDFVAAAEEAGASSDVCSTDRFILGAALQGELPSENAFFVTASAPCDGTRIAYPIMQKVLEIPTLFLESPYTYGREAARWYAGQLKQELIPFLEEVTGKKFDIDRFREVIEESNKAYELMVDLYEIYTRKPTPHPSSLRAMAYGGFITSAGTPGLTKTVQLLYDDAVRRVKEGIQPPNEEKYRVMWAHVQPGYDGSFYSWMEETLGATVVTTSLSSTPILKPIDTTSLDTMLEGYAWQGLDLTMSLMRMDSKTLWDATMLAYDYYNCDCLIVTQHPGCKSICGAAGLWRRYAREQDIPTLFIELDYNDDRVLSPELLRQQVEEFFNTVMV